MIVVVFLCSHELTKIWIRDNPISDFASNGKHERTRYTLFIDQGGKSK